MSELLEELAHQRVAAFGIGLDGLAYSLNPYAHLLQFHLLGLGIIPGGHCKAGQQPQTQPEQCSSQSESG